MKPQGDLTALVGSRICHDLISPLGAIGNGVELLELSGIALTPEMALIAESVAAAQARIRFFRIAYGAGEPTSPPLGRAEIASTLGAVARGGRLSYFWEAEGDVARREAKAIFLLLQCIETAMPVGGDIRIRRIATGWEIVAESDRMVVDEALWTGMLGRIRPPVTASHVQFALLPQTLTSMGKVLALKLALGRIIARF
jgi:histidine phosphotransferase ChpT